nr:hypothetical protein [Flavobacterium sp. ASV13]
MDTSPDIFNKILEKLYCCYNKSCNLEELTLLVFPAYYPRDTPANSILAERENQAVILEALIILHDKGYVFLNSAEDHSYLTIKGMIKTGSKILCS